MPNNTNNFLIGLSQYTLSKITKFKNIEDLQIGNIKKGLLSIHSVLNGKLILNFIDTIESCELSIHIIDIEEISAEKQKELIDIISYGYFE